MSVAPAFTNDKMCECIGDFGVYIIIAAQIAYTTISLGRSCD